MIKVQPKQDCGFVFYGNTFDDLTDDSIDIDEIIQDSFFDSLFFKSLKKDDPLYEQACGIGSVLCSVDYLVYICGNLRIFTENEFKYIILEYFALDEDDEHFDYLVLPDENCYALKLTSENMNEVIDFIKNDSKFMDTGYYEPHYDDESKELVIFDEDYETYRPKIGDYIVAVENYVMIYSSEDEFNKYWEFV